jgi:hypothetical protein
MLPHRAASLALERARAGHIPYDFEMDYSDPSHLFCSEVASWVYRELGVTLWMGISTISKPGLRRWLASFGVRHFETQEPSDLEYDPQLAVVAEWRDAASLFDDHIDNAVIDAMLEGADRGDRRLPVVCPAGGTRRQGGELAVGAIRPHRPCSGRDVGRGRPAKQVILGSRATPRSAGARTGGAPGPRTGIPAALLGPARSGA